MRTSAFIFDMDGTMVDSLGFHAKSWTAFARQHGIERDMSAWMRSANGHTAIECVRQLIDRPLSDEQARAMVVQKDEIYRALFGPAFSEIAGFRTFTELVHKRGLKMGVGSAGSRDNIAFVLQNLQLTTEPQVLVGGDEGLAGKPDPAIFLEAARRLNVPPGQCIVFEDAPLGIEAARRAGMRAVAICSTHSPEHLAGPHVIASARHYQDLMDAQFLETLDVSST
jgi:beta-phosphoglucomutase family hydrolase